jgi:hypothetical protein
MVRTLIVYMRLVHSCWIQASETPRHDGDRSDIGEGSEGVEINDNMASLLVLPASDSDASTSTTESSSQTVYIQAGDDDNEMKHEAQPVSGNGAALGDDPPPSNPYPSNIQLQLNADLLQGQLNASNAQLAMVQGQLSASNAQLGMVQGQLNASNGQLGMVQGRLNASHAQLGIVQGQLDQQSRVADLLRKANEKHRSAFSRMQSDFERERERVDTLRMQVQQVGRERARLAAELKKMKRALKQIKLAMDTIQ